MRSVPDLKCHSGMFNFVYHRNRVTDRQYVVVGIGPRTLQPPLSFSLISGRCQQCAHQRSILCRELADNEYARSV